MTSPQIEAWATKDNANRVDMDHEDALAIEEERASWDGLLHLFRLVGNQQISARKGLELAKEIYYGRVAIDSLPPVECGEVMTGEMP